MNTHYPARIQRALDAIDADVIALVPGANLTYFTGNHYHLSERPLIALLGRDGLSFIVPQLEVTRLHQRPELEARTFIWSDTDGFRGAFRQAVEALGLGTKRLGVDGQTMRVFEWLTFQEMGAGTLTDVGRNLLHLRAIKTSAEVEALRQAIRLSETALERTLAQVRAGMTELAIRERLNEELKLAGCQNNSFDPLVLIGENSALPHGMSGQRTLQPGDILLIDFGGLYEGYPADITRTFCFGEPSDEIRRIYDAVERANAAGRKAARPGIACGEVDRATRDVIEQAGYGEYFTHRTGHGLGLEVHELPQIASGVTDLLETGMVFTIEPGIYLPGIGGVRIEDDVIVTETGIESLTEFPRGLRIL